MHTEVFRSDDLIRCYAPPNLRAVMPGNKVMLRSGGPEMTVSYTDRHGRAVCQWMADSGLQTDVFDLECLTCFGAR
jgi:uncharacterized protein YodC (DUF2158 family)